MQKKLLTNGNIFKRTDARWNGVVRKNNVLTTHELTIKKTANRIPLQDRQQLR